jgi:PKD repeat protein
VNPANLYTNAGSYTVSLTANGPGGTNTLTQTNYVVVTNPPPPIILQPTLIAWGLQFSFLTVAGVTYQVEYKDALTESLWQPLESILGDGTLKFFTNSVPPPAQRFYRISVH